MFETISRDLRHGARMLAKNPGFTVVAIISLAIGVGANAAMFSVADGLILRPLAVPQPGNLVTVSARMPDGEVRNSGVSYRDFVDLRERAQSFSGLTAWDGVVASFAGRPGQPAVGKFGLAVSGNFFDVLESRPALGRAFVAEEDRVSGRDAVMMLSHETWTQQFVSDPGIVGRRLLLGGSEFTVIGVTAEGFTGVDIYLAPAFYVPLAMLPSLDSGGAGDPLEQRDVRRFSVMGRLKADVSLEQADQEARLIAMALEQTYPATNQEHGFLVRREMDARIDEFAPPAMLGFMLMALAFAVLLVACANVAGLLASRAPVRAREIALRLAIGGSEFHVFRQLVTESFLIATAGGALGLLLAEGIIRSFRQFQIPSDVGVRMIFELDRRTLVAGLVIALASALLSSLAPAWRASRSRDLAAPLRNTTAPASGRARLWGRHGLVAAQIGLTLVVLTVAVSFYRVFQMEYSSGPGFRTDRILLMNLDPALARYDQQQTDAFFQLLEQRAEALPGVTSVGLTSFVPLSQEATDRAVVVPEGFELPAGREGLTVAAARIDDGYLDTIGVHLLRGRGFNASDTPDAPRVAIVNSGMAARYWPDEDPIGKRLRLVTGDGAWLEIVGVSADHKYRLFTSASSDFLYLPRSQNPIRRGTILLATDGESAALAAPLREAVIAIDPNVPIRAVRTMEDFYFASAKNLNTVVVRTVAGMGSMGLVLAMVGLYGLTAYAVSRRTREIGIRMAMGALPASVQRMVLRQGWLPTISGVVLGAAASVAAGRLLDAAFPNTSADLVTYLLVVPALIAIVMTAAYLPARRATRIDPLRALRQD